MIAMEMADKNPIHAGGRDVGKDELSLSPFAGIEEKPLPIPAHEIGAVVASAGRLLAGTS